MTCPFLQQPVSHSVEYVISSWTAALRFSTSSISPVPYLVKCRGRTFFDLVTAPCRSKATARPPRFFHILRRRAFSYRLGNCAARVYMSITYPLHDNGTKAWKCDFALRSPFGMSYLISACTFRGFHHGFAEDRAVTDGR